MATTLFLYQDIGGFGTSAADFIDQVNALGDDQPIDLRINSTGGDVFEGYAIYNALRRHKADVTVYVDGLAASIASYIAMAGNQIFMAENAMLMIHLPYSGGAGTADEMRKNADILDMITSSLVDAYASRTGIPDTEIRKMLGEETWMDSRQALAFGFVDGVTEPLEMAAKFDVTALSKFKNVPEKLKLMATEPKHEDSAAALRAVEAEETSHIEAATITPDAKPSIFARVKAMLADKSEFMSQIESYKAQLEEKDAEIVKLSGLLSTSSAALDAAMKDLSQFKADASDLETRLAQFEAEAKTASERAIDIVAAAGFPQDKLPAAEPEGTAKSATDLLNEYEAIKDPAERTRFYRTHKDAIAKANAELKAIKR